VKDEGGPLGIGYQEQVPNHSRLLRSRAVVVSAGGKFKVNLEQVSVRETNESEPTEHASLKTHNVVETRGGLCLWDESVRCLRRGRRRPA
jgi:hypothetical protein